MRPGRRPNRRSTEDELANLLRIMEGTDGMFRSADLSIQFENKSVYGLSRLRDRVFEDGVELLDPKTATRVVNGAGTYDIDNGTGAANTVRFSTAVSGRYLPQRHMLASLGTYFEVTPTGGQEVTWGYHDGNNGFPFIEGSDGLAVAVQSGGARVQEFDRTEWNLDKLDGKGPSGLTIDMRSRGYVFGSFFEWYGFGDHFWCVKMPDSYGRMRWIPVHVYSPSGGVSVENPNLPLSIYMDNAGVTSNALTAKVGGRGVAINGAYQPQPRVTGIENATAVSVADGVWTALAAIRRKSTSAFPTIGLKPSGFDILATDADIDIGLFVGETVSEDSTGWRDSPPDIEAAETGLEWLEGSQIVSFTPGTRIWPTGIRASGTGSNTSGSLAEGVLQQNVPDRDPLVLAAKGRGSTANVEAILRLVEEW